MDNLTKEQLQMQLKAIEVSEKDAKKQEQYNELGKELKMIHQGFINAGFPEDIATTMLLDIVRNSMKKMFI